MANLNVRAFKERLVEMRRRLTEQIHSMEEAVVEDISAQGDLSTVPTHNADRDSEGLQKEIALERNQGELLNAVEAALQRIEDGTYGVCEHCGKALPKERLDALPHAAHCVQCEEAAQR